MAPSLKLLRIHHLHGVLMAFFSIILSSSLLAGKHDDFRPGYILIGQDTIKGYILVGDHNINIRQCIFREQDGQEREYSPDEIAGYGVNGKSFFYAANIETDPASSRKVFLQCLVNSKASLFIYRSRFFIKGKKGFQELVEVTENVQKNGKTFTAKRPLYKSVLQEQLDDCTTIHENLVDAALTQKSLISLFKNYASCVEDESQVFDFRNADRRVRYGFALGLLAADLKLRSDGNTRYMFGSASSGSRSLTFTPSFLMEFYISRKFNLCSGLNWYYTRNELNANSQGTNLTNKFLLEASRIEVPIILKYSILKDDVRFSLKAGCGLDGLLKYTNRLTVTTTSSGFVLSEYTNDLKKNRLLLNGMGGVCVEFSLGTHTIIMEGYYCRSGSLVQTETHASLDGFKLSIGMFL